jgi:HK97 family phage major capsid protein
MNKLEKMYKRLKTLIGEARTLNVDNITDEQRQKYDDTMKEIRQLKADIKDEEELQELEGETGKRSKEPDKPNPEEERAQAKADEQRWKGFGDFLQAVAKDARGMGRDERLVEARQAGLNEGVPSEGGFLVKTDFAAEMIKRTYANAVIASRAKRIPVSANSNGLTMNGIAETSRVTGSRYGGIQAYWLHEGGTKTPSMPAFRQIELKLKKLIGLCYATDELLQDTEALKTIITDAFSDEFSFMVDDALFSGNGVGRPLGITGHAATVAVAAEAGQAANTILYENIVNMWSRMWGRSRGNAAWFINQDIEPQLFTMSLAVGVGGVPVYMPAGGASASPYGMLFGRPVIPIEQASTLGTIGDITLADMSQYLMIDKGGVQRANSIHVRFLTDESTFRFVYRCDGQPLWNAALTPASGSANTLSPFVQLATRS